MKRAWPIGGFLQNIPTPNVVFSGLDQFPNVTLDDLGIIFGPESKRARSLLLRTVTRSFDQPPTLRCRHSLKFGVDWRNLFSPQTCCATRAR